MVRYAPRLLFRAHELSELNGLILEVTLSPFRPNAHCTASLRGKRRAECHLRAIGQLVRRRSAERGQLAKMSMRMGPNGLWNQLCNAETLGPRTACPFRTLLTAWHQRTNTTVPLFIREGISASIMDSFYVLYNCVSSSSPFISYVTVHSNCFPSCHAKKRRAELKRI